jgi:hypothetical protein
MLRKLLILLIKIIPIIQMVGMIFNNVLYYYKDIISVANFLDYSIGNSIVTTILLLCCSYVFMFCKWHRLLIYGNFINVSIASYDSIFHIDITDMQLINLYLMVDIIFILLIVYYKIKCKDKC